MLIWYSLLQEASRNRVLEENNTEKTYFLFIKIFSEVYHEAFPMHNEMPV